ncbi:MAG: hypothetical protein AAF236_04265 [Verrucomicrobiota bacterium]
MSYRNRLLLKGAVILVVLFGLVWSVASFARSLRPSPEKIAAYLQEIDFDSVTDPDQRRETIATVADWLNAMEPHELQELQDHYEGDPRQDWMGRLTPEEQLFFVERRIGRAFEQMMEAFNEMDREERKKIVSRALKGLRDGDGSRSRRPEQADEEMIEKIADAGFRAYLKEASAETKLDLAPLMEEMQSVMGGRRR